ncbi:DUF1501 domain-containing protein [Roseibacillus persicicus]|uniref:Sulfatase n=1 Tax=Roseibacillus persicicus TaxID=454148 RepID=A0A918WG56_9BACT|nr:DUF1501 domain-containing protein [Roseibacillus persicicus]MDQ8189187.1 DUF1501 domain-containing protein [Roseibacillus persicicus]GHC43930.1 sulfatase [Roseibacillus persicicus]
MHCNRFTARPITRRELLQQGAHGIGAVALASLMNDRAFGAQGGTGLQQLPHYPPKAKNVIFLYMDGGPSHIDTFDYKPALEKYNGRNASEVMGKLEPTQFDNVGTIMGSPWDFKQHGESGHWVSSLFPHVAKHADKLAVIKSCTSLFSEHTAANYFLHTGSGLQGRPSMGAWVGYGLGSSNQNLPGFVVLNGGLIPPGGLDNFNSSFLPATYQGSIFKAGKEPLANIVPMEEKSVLQRNKLDALRSLDDLAAGHFNRDRAIEAAVANYETAFRMQTAVPDLMDLRGESEATRRLYGLEDPYDKTQIFGRQCLVARRLVERGVRFVELTCPDVGGDRWDQHSELREGHENNCKAVDQPIAGLLTDLQARGLLEDTLVVWAGEFGRTPFAQGANGRDHNPFGFTVWMAGGGVKGGVSYGETDEFGYKAVQDRVEMHDLHATILYLLGLEHEKSTFRFGGRDMRLTDVHGRVIKEILA